MAYNDSSRFVFPFISVITPRDITLFQALVNLSRLSAITHGLLVNQKAHTINSVVLLINLSKTLFVQVREEKP